MNKPEPEQQNPDGGVEAPDTGQAKPGMTLQAITETMADPEFTAEQLPELWQQLAEDGRAPLSRFPRYRWKRGIEAMYSRCAIYPQYTELVVVLGEMPAEAWHATDQTSKQVHKLLRQATPKQLQQALDYERQHPQTMRLVGNHILSWAVIEQLTGPVIEQLGWDDRLADTATRPTASPRDRWRHIREHIQQDLLDDSSNAWVVLCGIAEPGTPIGIIAELAIAIEQQTRPVQ